MFTFFLIVGVAFGVGLLAMCGMFLLLAIIIGIIAIIKKLW